MFKEILKIIPRIEGGDLGKMEKSLNTRFSKIAKKFGSGLKAALVGGGVTALAIGVIDKLLNPLKETQEAIDNLLKRSDDLATFAKQFGTSALNLYKLEQIGKAKGVDPQELRVLLLKFQTSVAEAIQDPSKPTAVRNFAKKGQDNAEAFLQFITALQKLSPEAQSLAQSEIFGEKNILKMSEFMQEKNFPQLMHNAGVGGLPAETEKLLQDAAELEEKQRLFESRRQVGADVAELSLLNENMLRAQDASEQLKLGKEIKNFGRFDDLRKAQLGQDQIVEAIGEAFQKYVLPSLAPTLQAAGFYLKTLGTSRPARGVPPKEK